MLAARAGNSLEVVSTFVHMRSFDSIADLLVFFAFDFSSARTSTSLALIVIPQAESVGPCAAKFLEHALLQASPSESVRAARV